MNAVEIEEAISALTEKQFDKTEFPFGFLLASLTLKKLHSSFTSVSSQNFPKLLSRLGKKGLGRNIWDIGCD